AQVTALCQLYETAADPKLRLRDQMVLLAHQGRSVAAIAAIVFRSRDTVERVLKRFLHGGVTAIPPRKAPGMAPTVTPEWQAELLRVIDLDPYGGRPQGPLDQGFTGHVSGDQTPHDGYRRDRTLISGGGGLCLQALHLHPQTQSR